MTGEERTQTKRLEEETQGARSRGWKRDIWSDEVIIKCSEDGKRVGDHCSKEKMGG